MQKRPRLDLYSPNGDLEAALGPGAGGNFVEAYFPHADKELLIATAYFSVQGYDTARDYIQDNVFINILVGKRDGPRVQEAVMEEIKEELSKVHPRNLYSTVEDILDRLQRGQFRIADARQMSVPFHCKFYVINETLLWHGSANFSTNGLLQQSEQTHIVQDPTHIQHWTDWFHEIAATARDLHEELIEALQAWLRMDAPFEVYLKILLHLLETTDLRREGGALSPVYYQKQIAAWAARQVCAYGGALLVVATGLGKTVIGAEIAGILHTTNEIGRIILLAPHSVHGLWETELQGRSVPFNAFDNHLLFKKKSGKEHHQISKLAKLLGKADDRTLIVVDEAHLYRNGLLKHRTKNSRVIERFQRATRQGARVALMTGSAYGTNVQNLDTLLHLLPHRNPNTLDKEGAWRVESLQDFNSLPPVIVFGYAHALKMARERGDTEDGHPYIDFETGKKYLPLTFQTQIISYDLPIETEVEAAFRARCFDQTKKMPTISFSDEKGEITTVTDSVYNVTLHGWLSSPRELNRCIAENLESKSSLKHPQLLDAKPQPVQPHVQPDLWGETSSSEKPKSPKSKREKGYAPDLHLDFTNRRPHLESLQQLLAPLQNGPDHKAKQLVGLLRQQKNSGRPIKVIVFVERLVTARYLKRILHDQMRGLRVLCTVARNGELKSPNEREEILASFSPNSHDREDFQTFNVLICTDADGIGVNLQDADTVINYDLTAGADRLVQRLGRILRTTTDRDRQIHVYTFRPSCLEDTEKKDGVYRRIWERYNRLFDRHEKSSKILGSRVLSEDGNATTISFGGEVDVSELMEVSNLLATEVEENSLVAHLISLEAHRKQAETLQETLHSARYYDGTEARLVVMIYCNRRYRPLVIEPKSQRVVSEEIVTALNLAACSPDTPRADVLSVSVPEILDAADQAIRLWCGRHNENLDDVHRVAALYLLPIGEKDN